MARSQYIYGVWRPGKYEYIGFFTVKHEAITAMTRQGGDLDLHRYEDGILGNDWELAYEQR